MAYKLEQGITEWDSATGISNGNFGTNFKSMALSIHLKDCGNQFKKT